jgi:hypothetical protein
MSAVEKIKAKLSAYPGVRYSEQVDGIEIHATDASGFGVGAAQEEQTGDVRTHI